MLIEEQDYTECAISMSDDYNNQLWQKYDKVKQQQQIFMDCIYFCSNTATEVIYLLGLFDKTSLIRRKVEIYQKHSKLKFTITLMQIDRWDIDEEFSIKVDGNEVITWKFTGPVTGVNKRDYCAMEGNLAIEQDQLVHLVFEVVHITNVVEIVIDTSLTSTGQWGLQSFIMSAVECLTGDCLKVDPLTFDLAAYDDPTQSVDKRFYVSITFNTQIKFLSGVLADNANYTIWDTDKSGYSTSVVRYNSSQFLIYLNLQTTIRDNYMNVTFTKPEQVRDMQYDNTMLGSYNQSVLLPTYFYYTQTTIDSSDNIAFAVQILGIGLTLSLLPLILFKQFEVVGYTYFVHQMLYYYSFSDVRMPYNIVVFFRSFKVFNFDFLPNIFKIAISSDEEFASVPQFNKDSLFLNNAGYLYTLFFVFLSVYLIFKICANPRFMPIKKVQKAMVNIVKNVFEWNLFLEYTMLSFMHLLFAIFLQFFALDLSSPICYFSFTLCLITIILLFLQFYILVTKVFKNRTLILQGDREIERKYGVLWHSLKKESFYFQTCFNMILIMRRFMFIFITTFLHKNLYIQFNIFNMFNCIIMFIILLKKPYQQFRNNFKVFVSELQLIIIQIMIQNFCKDENRDEDSRVKMGWFMISQIILLIVMHYVFVAYEIIKYAHSWFKKQIDDAQEQLKQKLEKVAEESSRLLHNNINNSSSNYTKIRMNNQEQPQNAISIAVDDNLNHRRRRRSSQFLELVSNSNRVIGEDVEKGQSSRELNDILTVKSNFQDVLSRKLSRNTSILQFSKTNQNEEHNIHSILKKPSIRPNFMPNELPIQQDQSHDQKASSIAKIDHLEEEDTFQPRMKRPTVGNAGDQHMRHNRRKRNNTYMSQTSIKSFGDGVKDDKPNLVSMQQNYNINNNNNNNINNKNSNNNNNNIKGKRHRTNSKIFNGDILQEQLSQRNIPIKNVEKPTPVSQPVISIPLKDEPIVDQNGKLKQKRKKTKGVRVDSSQFKTIFQQVQES